jgi:hypothetical protein
MFELGRHDASHTIPELLDISAPDHEPNGIGRMSVKTVRVIGTNEFVNLHDAAKRARQLPDEQGGSTV